jgi:t-SNARE complex subunit (syntaxin)
LTEQQGELLDSIEYSVTAANEHVEYANEETVKAIEYQTAIRKKQWYVLTISSPTQ